MDSRHLGAEHRLDLVRGSIPLMTESMKLTVSLGELCPLLALTSCNVRPLKKSRSAVPMACIMASVPMSVQDDRGRS